MLYQNAKYRKCCHNDVYSTDNNEFNLIILEKPTFTVLKQTSRDNNTI